MISFLFIPKARHDFSSPVPACLPMKINTGGHAGVNPVCLHGVQEPQQHSRRILSARATAAMQTRRLKPETVTDFRIKTISMLPT
jgi:hypothetical protein